MSGNGTGTSDFTRAHVRRTVQGVVSGLKRVEHAAFTAGDRPTFARVVREVQREYLGLPDGDSRPTALVDEEVILAVRDARGGLTSAQDEVIHCMYWAFLKLEDAHREATDILKAAVAKTDSMTGMRSVFDHEDDEDDDVLYLSYVRIFGRWGVELASLADNLLDAGNRSENADTRTEGAPPVMPATRRSPTPQQQLVRDLAAVYGPLDDAVAELHTLVAVARSLAHHETPHDEEEEGQYEYMRRHFEEIVDELESAVSGFPEPRTRG